MSHVRQVKAYLQSYPAPPPLNVPCLLLQGITRYLVLPLYERLKRCCDVDFEVPPVESQVRWPSPALADLP